MSVTPNRHSDLQDRAQRKNTRAVWILRVLLTTGHVSGCFSLNGGDNSPCNFMGGGITPDGPSPFYSPSSCIFLWSTFFSLLLSAPCRWMERGGGSIARALAAASTGYGKELNRPPLTLPVLLWLMLLPQQEKSKRLEGGCNGNYPSFSRL